MIFLRPIIDRINALVAEDTEASITYAALEGRLALERVCYDRLRQRHDYISHAQLRAWQPGAVVNQLITEVDEHAATMMTMSMNTHPAVEGAPPPEDGWVEIGTQMGFNAKRIAKLWNALANLALHVSLPEHKDDHMPDYGDKTLMKAKLEEVVKELECLATGTMNFSGLGEEVSFECACGEKNKKRARLLKAGQSVSCINPNCSRSFKVSIDDKGAHWFELDAIEIPCASCTKVTLAPRRELQKMGHEEMKEVTCLHCGHVNIIQWILVRADLAAATASMLAKLE